MRISDWSSDVCSSDLVDAVEKVARRGRRILIPEVRALERQLAADVRDGPRLGGVDDRVLLVEDLEDAVGRGAGVDEEGEEEPDRLDRPATERGHGAEVRSVGKEVVGTCSCRWWPNRKKKKT